MSAIKLIVGLGNPGQQYTATRHNAGAIFLDALCNQYHGELREEGKFYGQSGKVSLAGHEIRLLFPTTFMNHSGKAVAAIAKYYRLDPDEILVAYDELDLPAGTVRLKHGGGHGGHNGVRDIINALGNKDFIRLRIGIGHPGSADKVLNYVLGTPSRTDADAIQQSIDDALAIIPLLAEGKHQIAMNTLHTRT